MIAKEASYYNETIEEPVDKVRSAASLQELVQYLVQKTEPSKSLTILLIGESGVGKATLVNGIIGVQLIVRNQSSVQLISKREINGIDVTVIDTAEIMGAEEDEIEEIKKETANGVDLVLYCMPMTQVRIRRTDAELIQKVREVFPGEIWNNAIFVLTYANQLSRAGGSHENRLMEMLSQWLLKTDGSYEKLLMEKLSQWKEVLFNVLEEDGRVLQEVAQKIPVIPAGYKDPDLPYCNDWTNRNKCEDWFSKMWFVILERVQCGKKIVLLEINRNRLTTSTDDIHLGRLPHEKMIMYLQESDFQITSQVVVKAVISIVFFIIALDKIFGDSNRGDKEAAKQEGEQQEATQDGNRGDKEAAKQEGEQKEAKQDGNRGDKEAAKQEGEQQEAKQDGNRGDKEAGRTTRSIARRQLRDNKGGKEQ